ncbi:Na+/H+ antiporter NhaC family protein [uncultured Alteromonas sp.]|uniref:Na+/H+ antiporter NhaC family protein n=1 Tax=uncultured Alteromonas sp. TaxID=179113 RepID=UPI0025D420F3|nr:Na+/H+ antiporter NhaC family protein [uncultured Alteromonas sp.]
MTHPDMLSVLPIVVTLALALYTKHVVIGLFGGVVTAVILLTGWHPLNVMAELIKTHLVGTLTDSYNAGVIVLMVFIGGFVALMEKSGGGPAFASKMIGVIASKAKAQIAAWCGGIFIFYSDLGTPLIIGPVFRPLFEKLQVSREKLAFIIDSTASPVAILVPFIGWGIYIMGLLQKEFEQAGKSLDSWQVFIAVIPYQFYALLAIAVIPLLVFLKADIGAMAKTEIKAAKVPVSANREEENRNKVQAFTHKNARASFVFLPLLVMALVLLFMLVPLGFPFSSVPGSVFRAALASAYFLAACTLIGLMAWYKVRSGLEGVTLYLQGMSGMMQVIIVLVLAWTLSSLGHELGTAAYIAEQAQRGFPAWLLPLVAFLLSAVISFATGSSWGTFAIMLPLVIPTAFAIDAALLVSIGAVLSGGLFGDHCSPISETTILSATGASCRQYDHFKTQLPYALMNGGIAVVAFAIAGWVTSPLIFVGALMVQLIVLTVLKRVT